MSSRNRRRSVIAVASVAIVSTLALSGCSASASGATADDGSAAHPIKIGIAEGGAPQWDEFKKAAEAQGIHVKLVNFTDYQLPNQALSQGELDVNQFQHLQFLAEYNVKAKDDLTPIGASAVYPLGLYSKKHKTVAEIPSGGTIAIPNDETNQARALLVLQQAGLITLKGGGNALSTPADIVKDKSKVKVTPVDAAQTAISLPDVDGAIINNAFVGNAKLKASDAIFSDDPDSDAAKPYINVWVTRKQDADNATYKKLVDIYHQTAVENAETKNSGGTAVFKNNSPADLTAILSGLEQDIRNSK